LFLIPHEKNLDLGIVDDVFGLFCEKIPTASCSPTPTSRSALEVARTCSPRDFHEISLQTPFSLQRRAVLSPYFST
jgi:hypothetical protein